ncbi:Por secretion system C-terminal sorting domain-containing protein [Flavobacterium fontis]|uniref:Por secretion system C-terminal sorting domain-containing protein n=1 Tax=Flavobacterium fontis TaxID=1124188 RepID=A0A1M4XXW5_9FLAO|nr:alpha-amylase family glycosyl hydrolase [Flavobacterium fontis]SHE98331.1 Por secretion system C-terminal sorting domain-containing protein [Flavobacterium fontis]
MRKLLLFIGFALTSALQAQVISWQGGTNPDQNQSAVILFDKSTTPLATYTGVIYAHTGVTLNGTPWQNVKGSWGNNTTQPALTQVSGNIYRLDLTPTLQSFYNVTTGSITNVNIVFRNAQGNAQTVDLVLNVGAFQSSLTAPVNGSNTLLSAGQNFTVTATNTNGNANYTLQANGSTINTFTGSNYSFTDVNVTQNKTYQLQVNQGAVTFTYTFSVVVNAGTTTASMPAGLEDGINYNSSDNTKATLVLTAPGKDFVYVAGSFNNYQPDSSFLMKRDPSTNKFWLELTNLTPGVNYNYQYWVCDQTPTTNSPAVVKTADPYSTLVLSNFDDPFIPASSYPNIPAYPAGQQREVTVLRTGQTPYNWSNATLNFVKPNKDNLVVYEVLVRDFDANRNFQDIINRIDYFKNLKINAIHFMPVMEFEGNESWGYNTSFHMALDKFYGTADKFKELIDLLHQNGIAVILDVALNHAFGRNPMVRMWMKDPDGDGWGEPAADNPYFNEFSRHSYNVGSDFNHSSQLTRYYTKRVVKHWIEEFKIDGFRWDLTKGFTQNCSGNDDTCTNAYQQDRVDVLREYVDYTWSLDPFHLAIFEHLGIDSEEQQWANYRINENPSKGVMMWGELTAPYTQLIQGFSTGADITRMGHVSRGFNAKRLLGYPESHDKDRIMYSALTFGNGGGTSPVINNLNNALYRMSAIGAISLLIPGPKMIWHFAPLGMNLSIFTCTNGTVNTDYDTTTGDCKLDTKPQPQWVNNWLGVPERAKIYNDWSKMIDLKLSNPVFNGDYAISPDGNNIRQRVYVFNNSLPTSQLRNVVILANMSVASQGIRPDFPYTGTWYNLMDNTPVNVTSTTATITVEAGGFRIYGNQPSLSNDQFSKLDFVTVAPNPTTGTIMVNTNLTAMEVYSITGQLVKSFDNVTMDREYSIEDLKGGLYVVRLVDENGQTKSVKLIKE